ncbi:alpha/beta hydrolase [Halapricum hydrolyticum]|uniref:Dienelactone hydrolase family protein n=1 Tax=Halapricum hydrolyticum TaxID=2979991 RepID=A0AAE3LEX2_9EURY|nr:CocE/NonD family hydrolase [Halapricum hydrolyticum]MCU4717783.1 dienelactone hydrolase family protein [Halapricum hydrolyticum]MCU4726947.1 dienelactone hydrolase family protein [Halapricum hydrolyticum]
MADRVPIPGGRDVRAVRDGPENPESIVVACPPHPRQGGSRADSRLTSVADALGERSIATLRFDYGPWDDGRGEVTDAVAVCRWARDRYDRVGLFGYSFGGGVAILAAPEGGPDALSVLAPAATVGDRDVAAAVGDVDVPLQVVVGERDETVKWRHVLEAARERGATVERVGGDHFFAGQRDRIAETVASWLASELA